MSPPPSQLSSPMPSTRSALSTPQSQRQSPRLGARIAQPQSQLPMGYQHPRSPTTTQSSGRESARRRTPRSSSQSAPGLFGSTCTPCVMSECCQPQNERMVVKLEGDQPVVAVPVHQEIIKRDKYIEVPQIEVSDTIIPRVFTQAAVHDVPRINVDYKEKEVSVQATSYVERPVEVPVPMGYTPHFVPKWDIREVPRPVPKYHGEQEIIEVEVPQVKYVDKYVEKEIVVDIKEKVVPVITEVEKEVEVVQYQWREQYQDVPVYKYVPKFDVELDCPPPLIVPYPETKIVKAADDVQQGGGVCSFAFSSCCAGEQPVVTQKAEMPPLHQTYSMLPPPSGQTAFPYNPEAGVALMPPARGTSRSAMFSSMAEPVYPVKTQEEAVAMSNRMDGATYDQTYDGQKTEKQESWWSSIWPFNKSECCAPKAKKETVVHKNQPTAAFDPRTGYPSNLPSDFSSHFANPQLAEGADLQDSGSNFDPHMEAEEKDDENQPSELEPTVQYKGAVNKAPEYGGELEPISFKLHAVEIHQFIPLPNIEIPDFVKALPNGVTASDTSGLEKFFGPVPSGWADATITGMPAPMMNDILNGSAQVQKNQLFQQISKASGSIQFHNGVGDLGSESEASDMMDVRRGLSADNTGGAHLYYASAAGMEPGLDQLAGEGYPDQYHQEVAGSAYDEKVAAGEDLAAEQH